MPGSWSTPLQELETDLDRADARENRIQGAGCERAGLPGCGRERAAVGAFGLVPADGTASHGLECGPEYDKGAERIVDKPVSGVEVWAWRVRQQGIRVRGGTSRDLDHASWRRSR
jgi:hypothetical protein